MTRNYAITRSSSGKPRWCDHCANAEADILLNEHVAEDGPTVFAHACRLGAEGIVSKRVDGTYRSGPCSVWIKVRNPESIAVQRSEAKIGIGDL